MNHAVVPIVSIGYQAFSNPLMSGRDVHPS
jgi:hypothetical protein